MSLETQGIPERFLSEVWRGKGHSGQSSSCHTAARSDMNWNQGYLDNLANAKTSESFPQSENPTGEDNLLFWMMPTKKIDTLIFSLKEQVVTATSNPSFKVQHDANRQSYFKTNAKARKSNLMSLSFFASTPCGDVNVASRRRVETHKSEAYHESRQSILREHNTLLGHYR